MEFLISQGRTKRKIEGAFWICASQAEFKHLIEQLVQETETFSYGWIRIRAPFPVPVPPSGSPEPWENKETEP